MLCVLAGFAWGQSAELISRAENLFGEGKYARGMAILETARNDISLTTEQRCDVVGAMALFCEELTGDHGKALECYRYILGAGLMPNNTAKSSARTNMMRLESSGRKYAEQNALLDGLDDESAAEKMTQLSKIAAKMGDYYRIAEVYYYIGVGCVARQEYAHAAKALEKAVQLKPGMDVYLPVEKHTRIAQQRGNAESIEKQRWAIPAGLLAAAAIVLVISKSTRRKGDS